MDHYSDKRRYNLLWGGLSFAMQKIQTKNKAVEMKNCCALINGPSMPEENEICRNGWR
jgi:hypothetical protein